VEKVAAPKPDRQYSPVNSLIILPSQILNEALAYLTAVSLLCYTPVRNLPGADASYFMVDGRWFDSCAA
jgi:hypothetical protein